MDLVLKKYFDQFRGSLPPEIKGQVQGVLFDDLSLLNKWRYWKTSLKASRETATVYGAFDDLLVNSDIYIPLDYKTRGSKPNSTTYDFFLHQLDIYTLLLKENGYKTDSVAYLIYYYPENVEKEGMVKFNIETEKVETSIERAEKLVNRAIAILKSSEPVSCESCQYCNWAKNLNVEEPFKQLSF